MGKFFLFLLIFSGGASKKTTEISKQDQSCTED